MKTRPTGMTKDTRAIAAVVAALTLGGVIFGFGSANAVPLTWDGGGNGTSFSDGNNWSTNVAPNSSNELVFGSGTALSPNNNINAFVTQGLRFNSGAYTLTGNAITLDGGLGIRNFTDANQHINVANLILSGAGQGPTFYQASSAGSLNIAANIDTNGKILNFATAANSTSTISGNISGSGALAKTDPGTLILNGNGSYTGRTIIASGTLRLGPGDALSNSTRVEIGPAGILDFNNTNENFGSLQGDAGSQVLLGSGTANVGFNNASTTFAGVISGSGNLTKSGTGTLTVSGKSTYTGDTRIAAGTLKLGATSVISNRSKLIIETGAIFDLNNQGEGVGGLTGGGQLKIGTSGCCGGFFSDQDFNTTFSGVISGGNGTSARFNKLGTGKLRLTGASTYTAETHIYGGGALDINQLNNIGVGGTLRFNDGRLRTRGSFSIGRGTTLDGGNGTFDTDAGTALTHTGLISGTGGLVKQGDGRLILTNAGNSWLGNTYINEGTLQISGGGVLGAPSTSIEFDGGTLNTTAVNSIGKAITLHAAGGTVDTDTASTQTLQGVISGTGSLTKSGNGVLQLSGANTYTGDTQINNGTLRLTSDNRISDQSQVVIQSAGVFDLNNSFETIGGLSGSGQIIVSTVLNQGGLVVQQDVDSTFSGVIGSTSVSGDLTKRGSGTLILSGNNTYDDTLLQGGFIQISSDSNLGRASSGAELFFNGGGLKTTASMSIGRNTNLGISGGEFFVSNGTLTHTGLLTGTGDLTKSGNGILALTTPKTYTGDTHIADGVLSLAVLDALPDTNRVDIASGAWLYLNDLTTTIGGLSGAGRVWIGNNTVAAGLVVSQDHDSVFSGGIQGSGTLGLTKTGLGALTLSGFNSYTGQTLVHEGILKLGGHERIADSSSLFVSGGSRFDLNGYDETVGPLSGSGSITLGSDANRGLSVSQTSDTTYFGTISGAGSLTKQGSSVLTLRGLSDYTGDTVVDAGTLRLGTSHRIANSSELSVAAGAIFDLAGYNQNVGGLSGAGQVLLGSGSGSTFRVFQNSDSLFSGSLIGGATTGYFAKSGSATLKLSGNNSYGQATEISNGVLEVSSNANLGRSSAWLQFFNRATLRTTASFTTQRDTNLGSTGGTFDVLGGTTLTHAGFISGNGALVKSGHGTLVLKGTGSTYTGDTVIDGGRLALEAADVIGDTSDVVVNAFGTFSGDFDDSFASLTNLGDVDFSNGSLAISTSFVNQGWADIEQLTAASLGNNFGALLSTRGLISGATTNYGTLEVSGLLTLVGAATNGGDINISAGRRLDLAGELQNLGSLNLSGGLIGGSGSVSNLATLQGAGAVSATLDNQGLILANAGGVLAINKLFASTNAGELRVTSGATLSTPNFDNTGLVAGAGAIAGAVQNTGTVRAEDGTLRLLSAGSSNSGAGIIEVSSGNTVRYVQGLATNEGLIALTGGAFDNNAQGLINAADGRIEGRGTVRTGALANDGQVSLVNGHSDVFGVVQNNVNGNIDINDAEVTFFHSVTNDGTLTSNRSSVSFLGGLINNGTLNTDPNLINFTDWINNDPAATFAEAGDEFVVSNDILGDTSNNTGWDTDEAILRFVAGDDNAHTLQLYGIDLGVNILGLVSNFAWGMLDLQGGQTLALEDVKNDGEAGALYVNSLILADFASDIIDGTLDLIFGNGFNIYYRADASGNAYLGGLNYNLAGGGQLLALVQPANVPLPASLPLIFVALAITGALSRRNPKSA